MVYLLIDTIAKVNPPEKYLSKMELLSCFGEGIKKICPSWKVINYSGPPKNLSDGDFFIMFSYFNHYKPKENINRGGAIAYRQKIFTANSNKIFIFIDSDPLIAFGSGKDVPMFYRVSLNSAYPDEGLYPSSDYDPKDRWDLICRLKNIQVRSWRKTGDHILLLMQSTTLYSMKNYDLYKWINDILKKLRLYSKRKIIVRAKNFSNRYELISKIHDPDNNIQISNHEDLLEDLENSWACLLFNTSACVPAIVKGVPVFCGHPSALSWVVSNHHIEDIENPCLPDRQDFFCQLAYKIWSLDEFKNGQTWKRIMSQCLKF